MNRSLAARLVALAALTVFVGSCGPTTLKDIIEDKFEDFSGLETALKRSYIVGLQPAPGFPNLHCCWVGDKTPWEKIADSWSTKERTEVDAGITGIIKAVGIEINAKSTSYVEAKAEPFYRQQLLNIRHFPLPHCPGHKGSCAKQICSDSLKVGKVTVTAYVEWEGGVGVEAEKVGTVKIGNKQYTKDLMEARDIIVGYKMTDVRCGPEGVSFGKDKSPSAALQESETYALHVRKRYLETGGDINRQFTYPARSASTTGRVLTPPDTAASVITPPPTGVIAGQVIRVSTAGADGRPVQSVSGIVVAETDGSGATTSREITTDADGGAWIFVPVATALLTISHDGEEVLRTEPGPSIGIPDESPTISNVGSYGRETPSGIVESGSMVEIEGEDFGSLTGAEVNGEPVNVVAAGGDWAVIDFDAVGSATVTVQTAHGLESPPVPVEGVSISVEQAPPATMTSGQTSAVVLRITGTERSLPINFVADASVVTLSGGVSTMTVASSGGPNNTVRVPVTAVRSGGYTINYNLVADGGEE